MNATNRREAGRLLDRAMIGALFLLAMLLIGISAARAGEIVPSVGLTKPVDGDNDVKVSGGLAIRGKIAPMLMSEVGVSYRSDEFFGGDLKVRRWPVTASLYLSPIPALYAGGGVGWYHTTLDYSDALPFENETSQEFGVHVGGGVQVPITPAAGLDLNGRYVFMRDQESQLIPSEFNPDFWTTSLGLAIKF
jgi:hypothetical protein